MPYALIINGNVLTVTEGNYPQLSVGTEAEKPTTPSKGNMHIATDSGKTYICFVNGVWTLSGSPAYTDYSNHNGTIDNMMRIVTSGAATAITNATTHSMDMSTGTGSIGISEYAGGAIIDPSSQTYELNFHVQNYVDGVNGNLEIYVGLIDNVTNLYGVFFRKLTGPEFTWEATKIDVISSHNIGIADIVSGDLLTISGKGSKTNFLINGIIAASVDYTIASLSCYPTILIKAKDTGVTTAKEISIDFISWRQYI